MISYLIAEMDKLYKQRNVVIPSVINVQPVVLKLIMQSFSIWTLLHVNSFKCYKMIESSGKINLEWALKLHSLLPFYYQQLIR